MSTPYLSAAHLAAARRQHAGRATPADQAALAALDWRFLARGFNNAVYAFRQAGQAYCLKLYRVDGRPRAEREWRALRLLAANASPYAPRVYQYAAHPESPALVMDFVAGQARPTPVLTRADLQGFARAYQAMYALTPRRTRAVLRRADGHMAYILPRMRAGLAGCAPAAGGALTRAAHALWRRWLAGPDPALLARPAPAVFTHGDGNVNNLLWQGANPVLIDFEYSGWNDRGVDLGEVVGHAQAHLTPAALWAEWIASFALSAEEYARYAATCRLFTLFWLMKWWPRAGAAFAEQRFAEQFARAREQLA